jgi:gamma-glutamyltranspeptidase / glutathione hydrolase
VSLVRILAVAALAIVLVDPQVGFAHDQPTKRPTAVGEGGAAATVDALGTRAAIETLQRGGNAVDAAVAAAGVLGVVEPFSCGIGGGGFMVVRTRQGKVTTIDSRELSPDAMRPDSFMEGGRALAFDAARYSGLSAGVPGTVAGWDRALDRYGTLEFRDVLRPGIEVAREGFVVDDTFVSQTNPNIPWFDDIPSTAAIYLDSDGTARDVNSVLRNPDLARTYELIARDGRDGFYEGSVAEAMVDAARKPPVAEDADHTWRPGLMTENDVDDYTAPEREPTRIGYRGLDVWGMGPPSSGGSTVGEALNILEGFRDPGGGGRHQGGDRGRHRGGDRGRPDRTRALHLLLESSRFAFADRNAYLADPGFFDVPLRGLLSDSFAAERRALVDERRAAISPVAPGDPYDNQDDRGRPRRGSATVSHPHQSTTHLVVSDRNGTVVSYTFTIESTGGNGIVVPGFGFLLNNELTDFNFDSTTHPNRADGGKRPRSSMSPTIVTRDGEPFLAVGSPGGSTIIGTVAQVLMDRIDLGASLPQAIAAPRAVQRNTATSTAEQAFIDSREGRELAARYGHAFGPTAEIGAVTGLEFLGGNRVLAAAEPERRGGGSAAVVRR